MRHVRAVHPPHPCYQYSVDLENYMQATSYVHTLYAQLEGRHSLRRHRENIHLSFKALVCATMPRVQTIRSPSSKVFGISGKQLMTIFRCVSRDGQDLQGVFNACRKELRLTYSSNSLSLSLANRHSVCVPIRFPNQLDGPLQRASHGA